MLQVREGVEREEQLRYARISGATIVKNFLESFRLKRLRLTFLKWSQDVARERRYEELAERVELLRPDGGDIADPFGGDLEVYRTAREEIAASVRARATEWWP